MYLPAKPRTKGPFEPDMVSFFRRHETAFILLLCLLAALRIFIFCAAFPMGNNVDERAHVDLVYKYSQGHVPTGLETFSEEPVRIMILYSSPEYMQAPWSYPNGAVPPPLWTMPNDIKGVLLPKWIQQCVHQTNTESTQPPVYYSVAALWYNLGELLGIRDGYLMYWLRFMNVWIYVLLLLVAYLFVARLFPENPFLRLGVPMLLVFFPQDVFYTVNNDVLSALLFTAALYGLLIIYLTNTRSWSLYLITGLAVALTFLVKWSNIAIIAAVVVVVAFKIYRLRGTEYFKSGVSRLGLMLAVCVLPIALWLVRNCIVLGDITGSVEKVNALGWTLKPISEIFHHPIFTPSGIFQFLKDITDTFWQGELCWYGSRLFSVPADRFFEVSTVLFLVTSCVVLYIHRRDKKVNLFIPGMCFFVCLVSTVFLAGVSVAYDFGSCHYPSQAYPYMTSGRLISGVIVPFLILYLSGMDFLLTKLRLRMPGLKLALLTVICVFITVSEVIISSDVFGSAFNWFHMP